LIPELGLEELSKATGASHSSTWEKAKFVGVHWREAHLLTFYIAFSAFVILLGVKYYPHGKTLLTCRSVKIYASNKYKKNWISLIPDILTVVAVSACISP
jgi:hypothetical protein